MVMGATSYQAKVELHQANQLLDQRGYKLGLRTIELRQQAG